MNFINILNLKKMDFGQAIKALKKGKKVTRKGWNGKNMFLWLKPATQLKSDFLSDPILKQIVDKNGGTMDAYGTICMKTADNKIITGWLASQTDMLSDDWEILDGEKLEQQDQQAAPENNDLSIEDLCEAMQDWKEKRNGDRSYILLCAEKEGNDTCSVTCKITGSAAQLGKAFNSCASDKNCDLSKIMLIASLEKIMQEK